MRSTLSRAAATMPARDLRRRHLRFVDGDAGGGSAPAGGGQQAAPGDTPAGGEPPAGQPATPPGQQQPPAPAPAGEPADGGSLPDDPAALQRMVRDLRRENASARTSTRDQAAEQARNDLAQQIGRALGLVKDDEPADPAQLAQQVADSQAAARQAATELAVFRAAGTHQGDPNALLDSRAFLTKVGQLDPTAATFAADIDAAIKEAVTTNPKLKLAQAAGASGAEFTGGPGEQRTSTGPVPLHQAVSAAYAR